ncbi:hypothetical protein BDZ85DRAFT_251558 [Elsinoe ampelina]|uniref:Uncharacterized protein n=1 Tax=Elsinoe ampelina TaxID=302913 RepID=A0A6A6G5H8_9PEZI|nr:hypothetical protein BDZ85DRAFT_251558 [Elsinoe ampelina]
MLGNELRKKLPFSTIILYALLLQLLLSSSNSRAAKYSRKKYYYIYLREGNTLFLSYIFLLALRYSKVIAGSLCYNLNPDTASITSLTTAITSAESYVYSYASIKLSKVEEKDR